MLRKAKPCSPGFHSAQRRSSDCSKQQNQQHHDKSLHVLSRNTQKEAMCSRDASDQRETKDWHSGRSPPTRCSMHARIQYRRRWSPVKETRGDANDTNYCQSSMRREGKGKELDFQLSFGVSVFSSRMTTRHTHSTVPISLLALAQCGGKIA